MVLNTVYLTVSPLMVNSMICTSIRCMKSSCKASNWRSHLPYDFSIPFAKGTARMSLHHLYLPYSGTIVVCSRDGKRPGKATQARFSQWLLNQSHMCKGQNTSYTGDGHPTPKRESFKWWFKKNRSPIGFMISPIKWKWWESRPYMDMAINSKHSSFLVILQKSTGSVTMNQVHQKNVLLSKGTSTSPYKVWLVIGINPSNVKGTNCWGNCWWQLWRLSRWALWKQRVCATTKQCFLHKIPTSINNQYGCFLGKTLL